MVVIMTRQIIRQAGTCDTIQECAIIKINHENKVICTQIVTHCGMIQGTEGIHNMIHDYTCYNFT